MRVELDLADEVAGYIEYIPKDKLSSILSGLLVEAIKNKSSQKASAEDTNASSAAISEVMTLLKQMASGTVVNTTKQTVEKDDKPRKPPKKVITLDASLEADGMDDDLLAMLK